MNQLVLKLNLGDSLEDVLKGPNGMTFFSFVNVNPFIARVNEVLVRFNSSLPELERIRDICLAFKDHKAIRELFSEVERDIQLTFSRKSYPLRLVDQLNSFVKCKISKFVVNIAKQYPDLNWSTGHNEELKQRLKLEHKALIVKELESFEPLTEYKAVEEKRVNDKRQNPTAHYQALKSDVINYVKSEFTRVPIECREQARKVIGGKLQHIVTALDNPEKLGSKLQKCM